MLFFIITTGMCNLNCKYCGGSFPEKYVPYRIKYELNRLRDFIEQDKDAVIAFYGGEPLLNYQFIKNVMDKVEAKKFVIQTNGLLYEKLSMDYWQKFDAVLLSIDGRREVTDYYRGMGVYNKVIKAALWLRKNDYRGDLIARMTASERTDIYKDVVHLLNLKIFDHIHWQLDVGWSDLWKNFDNWCEYNYKPGLRALVKLWIEDLKNESVLGIVPFLGIIKRLLYNGPKPPCGAGIESFTVLPNGKILACPIAYNVKWAIVGDLENNSPSNIKKVEIGGFCNNCKYFEICGGRCLYVNREGLWRDKIKKVCDVTIFTINLIKENIKYIKNFEKVIYPNFNNSTEIIP
ncbi:MAG: TIGR04084 family radical SAM/SPASM domain-containing protein [Candidatus Methanomethyliaceae archaeon]|nr:TIGR04084 family radical SAM/SPASM domain-containing protein [Candidatus Methanomethyliaceae archaeon]MDW7970259.1 TIGR04084 family radical SAM/SPASM domain-containing protein [Nitrososphaerota archaeon]